MRTGCGKSQVSRYIIDELAKLGKKCVLVRHPMVSSRTQSCLCRLCSLLVTVGLLEHAGACWLASFGLCGTLDERMLRHACPPCTNSQHCSVPPRSRTATWQTRRCSALPPMRTWPHTRRVEGAATWVVRLWHRIGLTHLAGPIEAIQHAGVRYGGVQPRGAAGGAPASAQDPTPLPPPLLEHCR